MPVDKLPSEDQDGWLVQRERLVRQAIDDSDHEALQTIAALPGGFGTDDLRKKAWSVLLHTDHFLPQECAKDTAGQSVDEPKHPDEGQVLLDTKRSFVTYPKNLPKESKRKMQDDLQSLIVHVLRLYPTLSYFQGYHDIMSVLYLTFIPLPPPPRSRSSSRRRGTVVEKGGEPSDTLQDDLDTGEKPAEKDNPDQGSLVNDAQQASWETLRKCAQVVSLCRVRDAMGHSMDPMMGLLKMLQRLLQVADLELSKFSATISPVPTLPFFALSWILCLFSHDIDSLEPVQRMFDFLLSRNPVSAIYLAVAILVAKKEQMFRLAKSLGSEAREDPSLLHPLFSRLPPLYADTPSSCVPEKSDDNPYDPIAISTVFTITDQLLARYPWDGKDIRGHEIMGPGSVSNTYADETAYTLKQAEKFSNKDVVLPGATEPDPIPVPEQPRRKSRSRPNRKGTAIAVGILAIGIGVAVYRSRGGIQGARVAWWTAFIRSYASRVHKEGLWQSMKRIVHEVM